MRIRFIVPATLALVGAVTLAACGGDDSAEPQTTLPPVATTAIATTAVPTSAAGASATGPATSSGVAGVDFNNADVIFAQGMIPHHEQAIEMADIALDPTVGASDDVRVLATRIKDAQDPEIELMTGWLTAWDQPLQMDSSAGHDMSSMEGVMTADEMDSLGAATCAEFNTMWMGMMIRHHEGAISMAETVKASGSNPDVLGLADQIITAQQAEIDEMQTLLDG